MKSKYYILISLFSILLCLLAWNEPYNIDSGYILGSSKFICNGLNVYSDFHFVDTPFALYIIGLLYELPRVMARNETAQLFFIFINLINTLLLYKILKRVKITEAFRFYGIIFSLLIILITRVYTINLECIAMFFLLCAMASGMYLKKWWKKICIVLMLTMAVLCKIQAAIMIIPTLLLCEYQQDFNVHTFKKKISSICTLTISIIALYLVFTYLCVDTSSFWNQLFIGENNLLWINWAKNLIIQAAVFGSFGMILLPSLWKNRNIGKVYIITSLCLFTLVSFILLFDYKTRWLYLISPLFVITLTYYYQITYKDFTKYKKIALFFSLSILCLLSVYECTKNLDKSQREDQQNTLLGLNALIDKPSKVAVMLIYDRGNSGFSVFEEVENALPFDTQYIIYGDEAWSKKDNAEFVMKAIETADYIVMDIAFSVLFPTLSTTSSINWTEKLEEFQNEHNCISLGELTIIER